MTTRRLPPQLIQSDSKLLPGFPWPIICKPERIKHNCLRNTKVWLKYFHYPKNKTFWITLSYSVAVLFFASGMKIIGHGNTDNNLESHCTLITGKYRAVTESELNIFHDRLSSRSTEHGDITSSSNSSIRHPCSDVITAALQHEDHSTRKTNPSPNSFRRQCIPFMAP
jgi:hypothetical protein